MPGHDFRTTVEQMAKALPGPKGERSTVGFQHGTLTVKMYAPRGSDPQKPHSQDELYVVARGTGFFVHGDRREPFGPHDVLFAPAGLPHRFEDFSEDLMVWVIFYGPEGGEVTSSSISRR
jgi:mannose-6-phosphate isomerase-like protein (cupin superfamily)